MIDFTKTPGAPGQASMTGLPAYGQEQPTTQMPYSGPAVQGDYLSGTPYAPYAVPQFNNVMPQATAMPGGGQVGYGQPQQPPDQQIPMNTYGQIPGQNAPAPKVGLPGGGMMPGQPPDQQIPMNTYGQIPYGQPQQPGNAGPSQWGGGFGQPPWQYPGGQQPFGMPWENPMMGFGGMDPFAFPGGPNQNPFASPFMNPFANMMQQPGMPYLGM